MDLTDPRMKRAVTALSMATAAKAALDVLSDDLFGRSKTIDLKVFNEFEHNRLITPEAAMQCWYEKYAVWKLLKDLEQKLRAGQSAGRILEPHLKPVEEPHAEE